MRSVETTRKRLVILISRNAAWWDIYAICVDWGVAGEARVIWPRVRYSRKNALYTLRIEIRFAFNRCWVLWKRHIAENFDSPIDIGGELVNGSRTMYQPEWSRRWVALKCSSHRLRIGLLPIVEDERRTRASSISQNCRNWLINSACVQQCWVVIEREAGLDSAEMTPDKNRKWCVVRLAR